MRDQVIGTAITTMIMDSSLCQILIVITGVRNGQASIQTSLVSLLY